MDEASLLELSFCPCLLASMKSLVSGTEYVAWLNRAKPATPIGCGDDPLPDLVLVQSSPSPGDACHYRLP